MVIELQQTQVGNGKQRPEVAGTVVRRLWYQVCYLTYDRPVRATFLSLEEDT